MDYNEYYDEIYLEIYEEFGAESVSDPAYAESLKKWPKSHSLYGVSTWYFRAYVIPLQGKQLNSKTNPSEPLSLPNKPSNRVSVANKSK